MRVAEGAAAPRPARGSIPRRIGRALARPLGALPPLAILGLGWAVLIVYAFPGQMTQDSFDHLREARDGVYSDSHPPVINLIWTVFDHVIAGPFGMLVLQATTFLAGLYLLLRRALAPRRAAWLAVAVFVFPPVMAPMAVIWKDCVMAGFLALGAAGLCSERRGRRLLGLAGMFGATAVRYNAFGATLPLVVLLFEWRPGLPWLRRYALATAAWLGTTVAAFGVNAAITDHQMHYWHSSLAIYDIVGTLAHVDEDLPDAELRELLAGTQLVIDHDIHATARHAYSTRDFFPIVNSEKYAMWAMPINGYVPAPQAQRDAIERAWKDTITRYPGAFLRHRIAVTAEVIGLGEAPGAGAITKREFRYPEYAHQLGLGTGWSKLQVKMTKWLRALFRSTPLFVPYVYLSAALALLVLARRQRDALALLLSGVAMEGTLVPLAHSNDYRYSHWMVICTLLGAILLTARRYRAAAPPAPPPAGPAGAA